ncbi:MAG: hypothetical protein HY335_05020 [Deinococcus sp.]|nr:hypothetical protein [Deinococcus sp.]
MRATGLLLLALAGCVGAGVGRSQTSAGLNFQVQIPTQISIRLLSSPPVFDLSLSSGGFPPEVFPAYYRPSNGQDLVLEIFSNATSFTVTATAAQNFTPTLLASQLYLGLPDATTPADGTQAPDPNLWTSFGAPVPLGQETRRTQGYERIERLLLLQLTGAEEAASNATVTITYTITSGV